MLHPDTKTYFVQSCVAGFIVSLFLMGCSPADSTDQASRSDVGLEHSTHAEIGLPKRLAFMSGHVEAGLALYRAGQTKMAAPHLLHPVSETHASERVGLDALGFNGAVFEAVSTALEHGQAATEIEPLLQAAEANLALLADKAGGNPTEIISYLMETILEEYAIGVQSGQVTDPGEYQDAFGFTKVALKTASKLEGQGSEELHQALSDLLALWPDSPIPPENPTANRAIKQQIEKVQTALAALD